MHQIKISLLERLKTLDNRNRHLGLDYVTATKGRNAQFTRRGWISAMNTILGSRSFLDLHTRLLGTHSKRVSFKRRSLCRLEDCFSTFKLLFFQKKVSLRTSTCPSHLRMNVLGSRVTQSEVRADRHGLLEDCNSSYGHLPIRILVRRWLGL